MSDEPEEISDNDEATKRRAADAAVSRDASAAGDTAEANSGASVASESRAGEASASSREVHAISGAEASAADRAKSAVSSAIDSIAELGSLSEGLDPRTRRMRRRRYLFFGVWGVFLVAVISVFRQVLLPFFLALVVAYVFAPIVRWMQERKFGSRKLPRWVAVVILYLGILTGLGGFMAVGVPRLALEIEKLAREVPEAVSTARDEWLPELERRFRSAMASYADNDDEVAAVHDEAAEGAPLDAVTSAANDGSESVRILPTGDGGWELQLPDHGIMVVPEGERLRIVSGAKREARRGDLTTALTDAVQKATDDTRATAGTLLSTAQAVIQAVVKGVFTFFIMLMLSAYLLITSDAILAFLRSLWPQQRRVSFDRLVVRIDRGLGGVVRGQLLIAVVNGVLSGIGFYLLGLRYWPILTLVATLLSIIPIFGAILSTIPAVIIGLQQGIGTALAVLVWIIVIHQIEANLLNPKIMGDSAKVHPVLVVFALLAGESVFGIAGALLAVPVLSIVQSLFLHYREVMLRREAKAAGPFAGTTEAAPQPP